VNQIYYNEISAMFKLFIHNYATSSRLSPHVKVWHWDYMQREVSTITSSSVWATWTSIQGLLPGDIP